MQCSIAGQSNCMVVMASIATACIGTHAAWQSINHSTRLLWQPAAAAVGLVEQEHPRHITSVGVRIVSMAAAFECSQALGIACGTSHHHYLFHHHQHLLASVCPA